MRKPTICLCENKDADQLRGNREADQRLCFRYTDSTVPLLLKSKIQNFKPLAIFCACTARFVSDLVRNPNCWFSHAQAHLSTSKIMSRCYMYLHFMGLTQNEDVLTCGEHKTRTGPSCSKLTMSLVNVSLKFRTLILQIHCYFLLKKCENPCKGFSHFFNKK